MVSFAYLIEKHQKRSRMVRSNPNSNFKDILEINEKSLSRILVKLKDSENPVPTLINFFNKINKRKTNLFSISNLFNKFNNNIYKPFLREVFDFEMNFNSLMFYFISLELKREKAVSFFFPSLSFSLYHDINNYLREKGIPSPYTSIHLNAKDYTPLFHFTISKSYQSIDPYLYRYPLTPYYSEEFYEKGGFELLSTPMMVYDFALICYELYKRIRNSREFYMSMPALDFLAFFKKYHDNIKGLSNHERELSFLKSIIAFNTIRLILTENPKVFHSIWMGEYLDVFSDIIYKNVIISHKNLLKRLLPLSTIPEFEERLNFF